MKWKKSIRRWILDAIVLNPPPLIIFILVVFVTVFTIGFISAHIMDQIDVSNYPYNFLSNNIANIPSKIWIKDVFPVDIVYTWVNGSDPVFLEHIKKYRTNNDSKRSHCSGDDFLSRYYYTKYDEGSVSILNETKGINLLKKFESSESTNFSQFLIFDINSESIDDVIPIIDKRLNHYGMLCWTSETKNGVTFPWKAAIIVHLLADIKLHDHLQLALGDTYSSYEKHCDAKVMKAFVVIDCKEQEILSLIRNQFKEPPHKKKLKVVTAKLSISNFSHKLDDADLNRFHDNEELRYSLRSVERFMPWVRKIFIVTNGQIPYWLNLMHPRVVIVTHDQIYPDSNHLPTFSSASIETHLHRIPGLSKHFIYFNDDIFLGQPVWIDDFYSMSSGYKIYMSWSLPNCAVGCSTSWISDGFCDDTCYNADCDFDGGDCEDKVEEYTEEIDTSNHCSLLCLDSWLADGHCDVSCNVTSCAFDAGDCGMGLVKSRLKMLDVASMNGTLHIPKGNLVSWFNIPSLGADRPLILASYDTSIKGIRLLSIDKESSSGILILKPNYTETTQIHIKWLGEANTVKTSFNISYDTMVMPTERHTATASQNALKLNISNIKIVSKSEEKHNLTSDLSTTPKLNKFTRTGQRRLLNAFSDSLLYVNRLYNHEYGHAVRKVPAHVPFMFNKSIIAEMQNRFGKKFEATSSHKFRQANDMQFSFSYYYFLMNEVTHYSMEEIFDLIDTDLSGTWSDREIRTFMAMTSQLPVYYQDLLEVQQNIINCSLQLQLPEVVAPLYERYSESLLPVVSKALILGCHNNSLEQRLLSMKSRPKYQFKTTPEDIWHFKMISSNVSQVVGAIDDIRKHRRKFICVNNDLSPTGKDNDLVNALVIDMLEALYPMQSSFELPDTYRNRFSYVSELASWKWHNRIVRSLVYASIGCLIVLAMMQLFSDQISSLKRKWCRNLLNESNSYCRV